MLSKVLIFALFGHRLTLTIHVLVAQLLLGYLPKDRALWEQELAKKRSQYDAFKDEFLTNTVCHFTFRIRLDCFCPSFYEEDCFYLDCTNQ